MRSENVAWLLAIPVVDIDYLTGLRTHLADRLTILLVPQEGTPTLVVPTLEESVYTSIGPAIELRVWQESDDPHALVAEIVGSVSSSTRIAVSDKMYASVLLRLREFLPHAEFLSATTILARLRVIKSEQELANLRTAARLTDAALAEFWKTTDVRGMTAKQIKQRLGQLLQVQGLEPERPVFVVTSFETGYIHISNENQPLADGDPLLLDPGGGFHHYISDITRMAFVGKPPAEFLKVYQIVREAQERAREAVAPGVPCQEIDRIARRHITAAGYGEYFTHRVGHGLGLEGHELPFLVEGNTSLLEPNMVCTVEPGIYIPGKFGVRIEDMVAVTEQGREVLTQTSRDLYLVQ